MSTDFVYGKWASIGDTIAFGVILVAALATAAGFAIQAIIYTTKDYPKYKLLKEYWETYPTVTFSELFREQEVAWPGSNVVDHIALALQEPNVASTLQQIQAKYLPPAEKTA